MFTATCFNSKESSSGYVRTIYVYKITVHILGSHLVNVYGSNIAWKMTPSSRKMSL